jgi:hypothetical protein
LDVSDASRASIGRELGSRELPALEVGIDDGGGTLGWREMTEPV